ncbi:MAG TPA: hypothetical protein VM681_08575 [Candidatus Thermoplasmatota archaeon]|nr:hypothetical protein [Candidatus Thermoplasmatota archaeon]
MPPHRPLQAAILVLLLAALFLGTFSAASVLQGKRDPLGLVEGRREATAPPEEPIAASAWEPPPAAPPPPPDLAIERMERQECVAADGGWPGRLRVTIRNLGPGPTGGFLAWTEAIVTDRASGERATYASQVWEEDLLPGHERTYELRYGFPLASLASPAPLAPVPGEYDILVTIDRPTDPDYAFLGEAGILPEADETNNAKTVSSDGLARGVCR